MAEKSNTQDFIVKSQSIWGADRWDYGKVDYINSTTLVTIGCKEHGDFQQTPKGHLKKKSGCVECSRISISIARSMDQGTFLERATEVWGDRWDYTNTIYAGAGKPIKVICKEHGEFTQRASHHMDGHVGCRKCRSQWGEYLSLDRFKSLADDVWDSYYDYSDTEFTKGSLTVEVLCPSHGKFSCNKYEHLKGVSGCSRCSGRVYDGESFKRVASEVWQGRFCYRFSEYTNTKEKVLIDCSNHGMFYQSPETHLQGKMGCIKCQSVGTSKGEQEILELVESLNPTHREREAIGDSRMEIDIYIPSKRVGIEFNGLYWHSEKFRDKDYHHQKYLLAKEAGVKLIQVWEDDWVFRNSIVREHILQVLGLSSLRKIPARKTTVTQETFTKAKSFFTQYHIQGPAGARHYIGLRHEGVLVALAAFKSRGSDYELVRYATSANVQGGHSKIISYFERNFSYKKLITFADLTFGGGDLYRKTGWTEGTLLPPDYSYLVQGRREHKFNYRLKRFREDSDLLYEEGLSERELAQLNGILRVYDAGKIRFVKPHPIVVQLPHTEERGDTDARTKASYC